MAQNRRGRPMASRAVRVTPEFRKDIDVDKLARALIAVAISIEQTKEGEEKASSQMKKETRMT